MARTAKACLAAVAALALMFLVPGSAMAAQGASVHAAEATPSPSPSVYGCLVGEDEYGSQLPCELKIEILSPICDNDVPKLQYKVVAVGSPNKTVTITWINPSGASIVQAGLPLEGTVLWPGAVQDANGKGIDWPGWRLENGVWVVGDQFDWVRPSVKVLFQVNPEMTVDVAYPPSSPDCLTSPPPPPGSTPSATPSPSVTPVTEVLASPPPDPSASPSTPDTEVLVDNPLPPEVASTGSNVAPLLIGAAVLVVAGAIVLILVNRRRRQA